MAIDQSKSNAVPYSEPHMDNMSFDPDYQVNAVEMLVYNPSTGALDRMSQPPVGTNIPRYDYLSKVATDSVTDTITYKLGGSGGTTVATLTLVYTDSSKSDISTITKA